MSLAEVKLWGRTIGAVSWDREKNYAYFEYDSAFARSHIEVSPIVMPLARRIYSFPGLSRETFHGLPGMLADSLPDRYGNALMDAWLVRQGRDPKTFNAVDRLCYVGRRGIGALEFEPTTGPDRKNSHKIRVSELVDLAGKILSQRASLNVSLHHEERPSALRDILQVGTSAGGARAKAVIAWNPETQEVRSGQVEAEKGFSYWILKFDGVTNNRDKELKDPAGYGLIEYAYYKMASAAGIEMTECRLLKEGGRNHFMTRRFDRLEDGRKLHMQSLGGLAHFDFNLAGVYSYEQAHQVMRQLRLPMKNMEELFRRAAFNVLACNRDDHVKNIAFLMNPSGEWCLSPAFDVIYSYNPEGAWTGRHQMTLNGKREGFSRADFKAFARAASMKRGRSDEILGEVASAVERWPEFAAAAGVSARNTDRISRVLQEMRVL